MNILVINYEYPPLGGGGGVMTKSLVENLSKGHSIHILTSGIEGLKSYEHLNGLHVHRVRVYFREDLSKASLISLMFFVVGGLFKGVGLIYNYKIDLIHSIFVLPSGLVGYVLSKIFGKKHMVTVVGGEVYDPTKKISASGNYLTRFLGQIILRDANRIVAISSDIAKRAKLIYKLKRGINVINIGIDFSDLRKAKKDTKNFIIATVTRLVKRKNLDNLIRAMSKIKDEKVKLIIAGDGPEMSGLKVLANGLNLKKRISFSGYVSNEQRNRILSRADCFVLVSLHEGFGIVYLEAMTFGLPIIAGKTGGQNDFLVQGKTGYLVPEGDPDKLAEAIMRLKTNRVLNRKMGMYNKKIVKNYSSERMSKRYEEYYLKLLN